MPSNPTVRLVRMGKGGLVSLFANPCRNKPLANLSSCQNGTDAPFLRTAAANLVGALFGFVAAMPHVTIAGDAQTPSSLAAFYTIMGTLNICSAMLLALPTFFLEGRSSQQQQQQQQQLMSISP